MHKKEIKFLPTFASEVSYSLRFNLDAYMLGIKFDWDFFPFLKFFFIFFPAL